MIFTTFKAFSVVLRSCDYSLPIPNKTLSKKKKKLPSKYTSLLRSGKPVQRNYQDFFKGFKTSCVLYGLIVMRCAIWYHLHNSKNVKNTHGAVLPLVKLQAKGG